MADAAYIKGLRLTMLTNLPMRLRADIIKVDYGSGRPTHIWKLTLIHQNLRSGSLNSLCTLFAARSFPN